MKKEEKDAYFPGIFPEIPAEENEEEEEGSNSQKKEKEEALEELLNTPFRPF